MAGSIGFSLSMFQGQTGLRRAVAHAFPGLGPLSVALPHDAVDSDIFIASMATASQREGRATRRNLLKVRRMKISTGPAT
jgi:hypothetical protein